MLDLLKNTNKSLDSMDPKRRLVVLLNIFMVFLLVGILIGYIRSDSLTKTEPPLLEPPMTDDSNLEKTSYEGVVSYIGEDQYKADNVRFALFDKSNKEVILLKSPDQKLDLLEGIYVQVNGDVVKTKDGAKSILVVSEVVMNASN